jgi:hypothetical protein
LWFGQALALHQQSLGAVDHLAVLKRGFGAIEFVLQLRKRIETRNAEVEDRFEALFLQSIDDIGGNAGINGSLDRRRVALIDEHRDRPPHRAADLEHLFQHVAAGVFEIDHDHIGVERIDPAEQALHLADVHDAGKARLPQPLLEDRGTDRAFVDNNYLGRRLGAH